MNAPHLEPKAAASAKIPLLQHGAPTLHMSNVLNLTREAVHATAHILDKTEELQGALQRRLQRRRLRGKNRQWQREAKSAQKISTDNSRLLLVLGVISNPRTPHTRQWIRSTYMATAPRRNGRVILRFVMGKRGLNAADERQLTAEHRAHSDIEHIDASDFGDRGGIFSCIDKLFAWFPHAVHAFPGARFYAKADDDSYVDVRRLLRLLAPLAPLRNAYLGYIQYDSFITDEWKHCGWAAGPVGAAHSHAHGCPHDHGHGVGAGGGVFTADVGRSYGPFPFVVGALTVMGADLASWMRDSPMIQSLVAAGRASQASRVAHWDCGYSDVTLGYALARSNRSLSVVSVREAMRDKTYGAMNGKHWVVSHHLRTQKQFAEAHAEAQSAAEWLPSRKPCTPWPLVADRTSSTTSHGVGNEAAAGAGAATRPTTERERRELRDAMSKFGCCQQWDLCEVSPRQVAAA